MPTRWVVLTGPVLARLAFAFQFEFVAAIAPGLKQHLALDSAAIGALAGLSYRAAMLPR